MESVCCCINVAVIVLSLSIITCAGLVLPVISSLQPAKTQPGSAVAVKVIMSPSLKIPFAGETLPLPIILIDKAGLQFSLKLTVASTFVQFVSLHTGSSTSIQVKFGLLFA